MGRRSRIIERAEEAMSIKYNNIVYEMRARGEAVIVMSLGEAYFDIPLYPFDDLPFPDTYHYSHSRGIPELREKICEYFRREYSVSFDPATEIIVTAGSKIAAYMALMAILNPEDEVLYSEPVWVSYPEQIKLCHGRPLGIPYDLPVSEYERFITPATKAIIITNPHNPRGLVMPRHDLLHLLELAEKHDLWVISDEAYSDFVLDHSFHSLAELDPHRKRSIILNSLSKNLGLSGWRLGYVIANPQMTSDILKLNQHLITCPATILEYYIVRHLDEIVALTKPQIVSLLGRREPLKRYMDTRGLKYLPGDATFYFFVSIAPSRLGSEDFCMRLLREYGVCVVPGVGYGASCDQFVRVSVGTASMEDNKKGLDLIAELIRMTS